MDPAGRWYEYFSDAFAEIGRPFNGSQIPDGFFLISRLPNYVQIGTGFDVFPFEGAFNSVGVLTYDATGYSGSGAGTAVVTQLTADFVPFMGKDATVLDKGYNYTTNFSNLSGTVSLFDNKITAINLAAQVTFTYPDTPVGPLHYSGPFAINGRTFSLVAGEPVTPGLIGYRWELAGEVLGLQQP